MNIHEAANVASDVLRQYTELLSKLEAQGGQRYTNTIEKMREAKSVLDAQYPPPLGVNAVEYVRITERLG